MEVAAPSKVKLSYEKQGVVDFEKNEISMRELDLYEKIIEESMQFK